MGNKLPVPVPTDTSNCSTRQTRTHFCSSTFSNGGIVLVANGGGLRLLCQHSRHVTRMRQKFSWRICFGDSDLLLVVV